MMEISTDEEIDLFFQEHFDLNTCSEGSFFRRSALSNNYIRNLYDMSKLHIRQADRAASLFQAKGHVGLLHLFLPVSTIDSFRLYTNETLAQLGPDKTANTREFMAYIGLELATSLVPLNQLRYYWSNEMFSGHPDFKKVMSRNRFQSIRASLILKAQTMSGEALSSMDPLYSCRRLLDTIAKSFSDIAVPLGTSALDEASCRSKARNRAISFIPNKPDKFAIRFYCVVGSSGPYIHSIFDNGRGNTSPMCQVERFNHVHKIFGHILNNEFGSNSIIEKTSASALWLCQLLHQSKIIRPQNTYRVSFCDNFYTRPRLAEKLFNLSDGGIKMTGTCKYSNIDGINRPVILECMAILKDKPRGSWVLGRSYSFCKSYDATRKRSTDPEIKSYKKVPDHLIQANSGFIFFKDAKVVIFYSNDLANTPYARICDSSDDRCVETVRGLVAIERWTGSEHIGRSRINCPAIIVSYQLFMNGVDRVDQMRSTNPTKRREAKIHMSLWTYCLDLVVHQAYCVYKAMITQHKINENNIVDDESNEINQIDNEQYNESSSNGENEDTIRPDSAGNAAISNEVEDGLTTNEVEATSQPKTLSFYQFKRKCCEQLVTPHLKQKFNTQTNSTETGNRQMEITVGRHEHHILLPNKKIIGRKALSCHLCNLIHGTTNKRKSVFGCVQCSKGFHVECFAAYHHRHALNGRSSALRTIINSIENINEDNGKKTRKRKSDRISSMEDLTLPE